VSRKVARRLEKLGVKVMTDVKVEKVDGQGVIAGGTRIPSATVLWTAGVAASPIPKMLGTKTDRAGRALVDPFLKVVDARGVFVVGDAASVMQNEHPVPGVAQAAIQEGRYVGRLIAKELKGRKVTRQFSYFDKRRQELRGPGAGLAAHRRLPHVAGVGVRSHPLPAAAAEPAARTAPVVVVLFYRPAQLAPHPRATADAEYGSEVTDVCWGTVCPSLVGALARRASGKHDWPIDNDQEDVTTFFRRDAAVVRK
jgi:NADPH-dependent 2,4-dienoyl-CoA reductase/sulfur reductase-like enzyme